jgi:hypothetical protein
MKKEKSKEKEASQNLKKEKAETLMTKMTSQVKENTKIG